MSTRSARFWSAFVLGGLSMFAGGIAWQGISTPRVAAAQVPDSGAQRLKMIRELEQANKKLDTIVGLLKDIRDAGKPDDKDARKKRAAAQKAGDRDEPRQP